MLNAFVLPFSVEALMQTKIKANTQTIVLSELVWIIGLELRTSNDIAFETIPAHWQRFMGEQILGRIPNRASDTVYAVYTNYQNPGINNEGTYSCVLGAAVRDTSQIPDGVVAVSLPASTYQVVQVESVEMVGLAWQTIWQQDTSQRTFIADTECYYPDEKVEIHLGIHP
jgi:predicted transcriptional regulator YdeE